MSARTCRKCGETKLIAEFPTYRASGYEGIRHRCRECVRLYRVKWELNLTGRRAKRYYTARDRAERISRERRAARREREYRERRTMLRSLITALRKDGLTNNQIADMAGVSSRTIRRIMSDAEERVRFQQPVEAKIVNLYSELRGIA